MSGSWKVKRPIARTLHPTMKAQTKGPLQLKAQKKSLFSPLWVRIETRGRQKKS